MTELELHTPTRTTAPAIATGNTGATKLREAAEVMVMAKQIADAVCNTNMMPKHLRGKADETAAVMLYGATLGLDPMQSVRSIYEVHGQPGLYARAMVALAIGNGHDVWTASSTDEAVTVQGRRRGSQNVEESTWSYERARKAGYTSNEKYKTDPQAMLYAKAASEVCRKIAPDVLAGVYAVEELQSESYTWEQVTNEPAAKGLGAVLQSSGSEEVSPETESTPGSADSVEGGVSSPCEPEAPSTESALLNVRSDLAKRMFATINDAGITEAERLPYIAGVIGRDITSSKEMTEDDARKVITALTPEQGVQA